MKSKLMILIICLMGVNLIFGQVYPRLNKVGISCKTNLSNTKNLFYYKYTIKNDISSTGNLFSFIIDASLTQEKVIDTVGLEFINHLVRDGFRRNYSFCKGKIIPFGISKVPNILSVGRISLEPSEIIFSIYPDREPGKTVDSIEINCTGLPAIRKITFSIAKDTVIDMLPGIEDTTSTMTLAQRDSILTSLDYSTWTVGPNIFSDDVDYIGIIDSIKSYDNRSFNYGWIKIEQIKNKYLTYLTDSRTAIQQSNYSMARTKLQNILHDIEFDSSSTITSEAYALLRYNTEYLLSKLPSPYFNAKLVNSANSFLPGGSLQYYDGSWKDAINNNNGTFSIDTKLKTISLRMTYAYGSQTLSNVTVGKDTVVFQTVNTKVKLQNSNGNPIDQGTIQYYAGAWRDFGSTVNGTTAFELLPGNYSFRMTYAYASNDKAQDIGVNSTVVFQTVNANVQLKNSLGNLIEQGTVQYYSGAWRNFGTTTNGISTLELLPNNYSFRMTYGYASNDKAQDIGVNSNVIFQTVNAQVQLKNSLGNLIDQGTVQYYSGAWRNFGTTTNGISTLELLPNSYSFRMTYAFASNDKQQNIGSNSTVIFQTVNAQVQLKNSLGNLIDQGTVQYYSGAWRNFGITTSGISTLELLPNNYSFRITYGYASNDKAQDIGANSTVIFQTVNTQVQLKNSLGNFIDQGTVQYYSGAWRNLGTTTNGIASRELLSNTYSFRMTYGFISKDISQNIALNNVITYSTVLCTIKVNNSQNQPVNNADIKYYSGAWREIGLTSNGVITKELLPANLSFRVNYNSTQKDMTQDISINNIVVFGL